MYNMLLFYLLLHKRWQPIEQLIGKLHKLQSLNAHGDISLLQMHFIKCNLEV